LHGANHQQNFDDLPVCVDQVQRGSGLGPERCLLHGAVKLSGIIGSEKEPANPSSDAISQRAFDRLPQRKFFDQFVGCVAHGVDSVAIELFRTHNLQHLLAFLSAPCATEDSRPETGVQNRNESDRDFHFAGVAFGV
jgi:hypothetical protein